MNRFVVVTVAGLTVGAVVVTDVSAGGHTERRHTHVAGYTVGAEHWPRLVVEVRSSGPSLAGALGEMFVTST